VEPVETLRSSHSLSTSGGWWADITISGGCSGIGDHGGERKEMIVSKK